MAIQPKDAHLLWGKAAARCSMPDCRKPLVSVSAKEKPPNNVVVGEMAHIVGRKNSKANARGISTLPIVQRDKYPNLILLCPTHHTLIDKLEIDWPVERLYTIKREHELWVEQQLGKEIDAQLQIYSDFIDRVALAFSLEDWEILCDRLFRKIMPLDFPDAIDQLLFEHFRAVMPGRDILFEQSLSNLIVRSRQYLDCYLPEAEVFHEYSSIRPRKRYQAVGEDEFEEKQRAISDHQRWDRKTTMLLFNLVRALNEFRQAVQKELRPDYFVRKGEFCVLDSMGLMGGTDVQTWHIPARYFEQEELDALTE